MPEVALPSRDVKLENTLLDNNRPLPNVKLCDFGYSKNEFIDSRPKTVSGTPDYIAPEVDLVALLAAAPPCSAQGPDRQPVRGRCCCTTSTAGRRPTSGPVAWCCTSCSQVQLAGLSLPCSPAAAICWLEIMT